MTRTPDREESPAEGSFRFAAEYSAEELLHDARRRRRFLGDFLQWEGRFLSAGVGLSDSGLTCDGAHVLDDGRLVQRSHSNPSKEALHLALLGLAVLQDGLVARLLSPEQALDQLRAKAAALERCRAERPSLCGFMPWFDAPSGGRPTEPCLAVRYNGMLAWALYFVVRALEQVEEAELASRFDRHLQDMRAAAVRFAYKGNGKVAATFSLPPRGGPMRSEQTCEDPFAGELFCMFLDLLAEWPESAGEAEAEKDAMWEDAARQRWLSWGSLEVQCEGSMQALAAMQGHSFSVHEAWKHLLLPYDEVPEARRPFHAAERLRTWWSRSQRLPGMLGDCHVPVAGADLSSGREVEVLASTQHVATFGLAGVSALAPEEARCDHVAGNGAFALLLASPSVGAAWLHETLRASEGMQTPWGMAESCAADGSAVCPLLTWDAKATTALAVLGGLGPHMRRFLEQDGLFDRFRGILERLYGEHGSCSADFRIDGEMLPFAPPPSVDFGLVRGAAAVQALRQERLLDIEMRKNVWGDTLPHCDAGVLSAARHWFEEHGGQAGTAPYCVGRDLRTDEVFADWWFSEGRGHFAVEAPEDRDRLYELVWSCFKIGAPLVLLARQAERYPLFFDLDLYGGKEDAEGCDWIQDLAWHGQDQLMMRAIVAAVLELYPQFCDGLEVAVFTSSGFCSRKGRYKASYHLMFPDIIVDRPEKCHPEASGSCEHRPVGGHVLVRDHVVRRLSEGAQLGGELQELRDGLCECCSWEEVGAREDGSTVYLNDWCEVLDEKPLWHEPEAEADSGLRLPFTDKPLEDRPKVPLGRWRYSTDRRALADASPWPPGFVIRRLRELEPIEWIRLGDISVAPAAAVTPRGRELDEVLAPCPACRDA